MQDLIFASCDSIYFERFAKAFINSAIIHGNKVHVHIINPDIGLNRPQHDSVTYSFEEKAPNTREYYATNRFLVAPDIIMQHSNIDMRLLLLDIDCVIRKKIILPDAAVGLYLREPFGANEWERRGTRVAAGAVMYDHTAWLFAKRVAQRIMSNTQAWFVDQVSLAETYDEFRLALNVHDFNSEVPPFLDWEFREESIIWSAKGDRKDSPIFQAEQKFYEDLDIGQI